jgi:hypothetical protein
MQFTMKSSPKSRHDMEEWILNAVFQLCNCNNPNPDATMLWKLAKTYDRITTFEGTDDRRDTLITNQSILAL